MLFLGIPAAYLIAFIEENWIACLMSPKIVAVDCLIELKNRKSNTTITPPAATPQYIDKKETAPTKSEANEIKTTESNESEEKAKREICEQAKRIMEQHKEELPKDEADNGGLLLKCEKTLSDQILDALSYQNDETMIGYLRSLKNNQIDEILKQPVDTIRDSLIQLL